MFLVYELDFTALVWFCSCSLLRLLAFLGWGLFRSFDRCQVFSLQIHERTRSVAVPVGSNILTDAGTIMAATLDAVKQFLVRADAARNRRADEAAPTLLRAVREIWREGGKECLRDIGDACERFPFSSA